MIKLLLILFDSVVFLIHLFGTRSHGSHLDIIRKYFGANGIDLFFILICHEEQPRRRNKKNICYLIKQFCYCRDRRVLIAIGFPFRDGGILINTIYFNKREGSDIFRGYKYMFRDIYICIPVDQLSYTLGFVNKKLSSKSSYTCGIQRYFIE